jgi:uncharacterized protein HemX
MSRKVKSKVATNTGSKTTSTTKRISRKKAAALGALGGLAIGAVAALKIKSVRQAREEANRLKIYEAHLNQYKQELEKAKNRKLLSIVKSRIKRISVPKVVKSYK